MYTREGGCKVVVDKVYELFSFNFQCSFNGDCGYVISFMVMVIYYFFMLNDNVLCVDGNVYCINVSW